MIKLEILTQDNELATICELYWEVNSRLEFVNKLNGVAELAKVDKGWLTSLVRESCRAYISDWRCVSCGGLLIFSGRDQIIRHRKMFLDGYYRQVSALCGSCETKRQERELEEKRREEEAARMVREAAEKELRRKIFETYDLSKRPLINIQELSLTNSVYLLSILRGGAYENLTKIMPILMFEQPLVTEKSFLLEILNQLCENHLLFVHPDTEPEALVFVNGKISEYYPFQVYYAPPLSQNSPDDLKALVTELQNYIDQGWTEEWCQEALEIWKKVALSECVEYLLFTLNQHHFEFKPGEKTFQYLEYALEHYSTAQVFNTIWRSVKDAAAFHQREGISKRQAANAAIASIQRISERAIAENWVIKPFGRNYKFKRSAISEVLYNFALKLGDEGFQIIPNIVAIHEKRLIFSKP